MAMKNNIVLEMGMMIIDNMAAKKPNLGYIQKDKDSLIKRLQAIRDEWHVRQS